MRGCAETGRRRRDGRSRAPSCRWVCRRDVAAARHTPSRAPAHSSLARMAAPSTVDTVVTLCKRRGFVFPCGEIYGGTRSAWDYGPLGVELKENIKRQWWQPMVTGRDDVVGLDSSVILPRQTWVASGHVATFTDPLTECLSCHKRFRVDHLQEAVAEKAKKGKSRRPRRRPARRHRLPQLRHPRPVDRAAQVQHDAQDLPRRHRGRVGPALPAPRDRAGHLRQLPQRHAHGPQEAAVRHRPDRQELPQRDHPGQLHLPHARVRADGDGVLRQARRRRAVAPVLDRRAHPLVHRPRHQPRQPAPLRAPRRRSCRTTPSAPSTSSTASTSPAASGASSRASPTAPTSTSRRTPSTRAPTSSTSTRPPARSTRPTSSSRRPACRAA